MPSMDEAGQAAGTARATAAGDGRLMSPLGYAVVAAVMAATAGLVYVATATFHGPAAGTSADRAYEEMDLGAFTRELAPDAATLVREPFMVRVVLVLNPGHRRFDEMRALLEKRRNLMKDIVTSEILHPKPDAELRRGSILETLKAEIRQRLNTELGATTEGQEVIARVIIPECRLPVRR